MKNTAGLIIVLSLSLVLFFSQPCGAAIVLMGKASIPGGLSDTTFLTGNLEDGTPANRLGALGSGLAYTGQGNRYVALPDRGPADGSTSYKNRYFELDIMVADGKVHVSVVKAHGLPNKDGQNFIGLSSAFDPFNVCHSLRLDSEGIRVGKNKIVFISDEYGPCVHKFDFQNGQYLGSVNVPEKFKIKDSHASEKDELPPNNISGRQANRGMEGLAVTPNGEKLIGIMQSPLIQDHGLDENNKRVGLNVRLVVFDLKNNSTKEYLYPLDDKMNGLNEVLAVNDQEFLVIERDSTKGSAAKNKKIYAIDISNATDISSIASLPLDKIPSEVTVVKKDLFIDLLSPKFGLTGEKFPEKIEGLAFGPDLPDGRHLLMVTNDNDFDGHAETWFFAFAIDPEDLPRFQPQMFDEGAK